MIDLIRTQDRAFPPKYVGRRITQAVADAPYCPEEFTTPFPVIDATAIAHNLGVMSDWCSASDVELHPHIKSTMTPQLFLRQVEAGATGLTVATPAQLRYAAEAGASSVQLAGELVQPHEADWLARWLDGSGDRRALVWVDSLDSVEVVSTAAAAKGVVVDTLLEVGQSGGRCGVRSEDQRRDVSAAARRAPGIRLVGVAGYEGAIAGRRDEEGLTAVRAYFSTLEGMLRACIDDGSIDAETATVSAGGSMFIDLVVEAFSGRWPRVILRSGCYLLHDHGLYSRNAAFGPSAVLDSAQGLELRPALTVWATVVSRPEPHLALLDAGRRDVSFDQGMPVPLEAWRRDAGAIPVEGEIRTVNDQHAFLDLDPGQDLRVGDRVRLGISHPCTTMDKWATVPVVDPGGHLVDVVTTWF